MNFDTVAALIGVGVPVFPCRTDKRPACPHGFKDASVDQSVVSDLFGLPGAALIGVPTGAASGMDALDIDPRHGGDAWWRKEAHRLPLTRTHRTGGGGLHILFKHHQSVRNTAGALGAGVDTRGVGGYIIWWPAHGGRVGNAGHLTNWPAWLLESLQPKPARIPVASPRHGTLSGGDAAQRIAATALASLERAAPGQRHYTLRKAAYTLGGVLHHLPFSRAEATERLVQAAIRAGGQDANNAIRTAEWGIARGEAAPLAVGQQP